MRECTYSQVGREKGIHGCCGVVWFFRVESMRHVAGDLNELLFPISLIIVTIFDVLRTVLSTDYNFHML